MSEAAFSPLNLPFCGPLGLPNTRFDILEVGDRPLGPFDPEMVALLAAASSQEGIRVHTGIRIASIQKKAGEYLIRTDTRRSFKADLVVHGAGRVPKIESLNLKVGGIHYSRRGIRVDGGMQTSSEVYAVGDCAATIQWRGWQIMKPIVRRKILKPTGGLSEKNTDRL